MNENVKAVVRLATDTSKSGGAGVGGDPQSNNQDMNNGASKKPIFLDLAYIDWNLFGPDNSELHLLAGKMANPFISFNDDLIWDPDTTPEGAALKGVWDLSPVTLMGNLGYIVLNNNNTATNAVGNNEVVLYGAQGAVKYDFCPEVALTLGVSDYFYNHIDNSMPSYFDITGNNSKGTSFFGNELVSNHFANGYDVVEPFASLDMFPTVCNRIVPVSLYTESARNLDADHFDNAYLYGITLGKAKNPNTAEIGVSRTRIDRDSVLGMWTDSDRWGGGAGGEGYKFYIKYMIMKNLAAQITYYNDKKSIEVPATPNGTGYERMAFDLVASF